MSRFTDRREVVADPILHEFGDAATLMRSGEQDVAITVIVEQMVSDEEPASSLRRRQYYYELDFPPGSPIAKQYDVIKVGASEYQINAVALDGTGWQTAQCSLKQTSAMMS